MQDEKTETRRFIFASNILGNIFAKLSEGFRAINIEYMKEQRFSKSRQKYISVYEFICPIIKSQFGVEKSKRGSNGGGQEDKDDESSEETNDDIMYVVHLWGGER